MGTHRPARRFPLQEAADILAAGGSIPGTLWLQIIRPKPARQEVRARARARAIHVRSVTSAAWGPRHGSGSRTAVSAQYEHHVPVRVERHDAATPNDHRRLEIRRCEQPAQARSLRTATLSVHLGEQGTPTGRSARGRTNVHRMARGPLAYCSTRPPPDGSAGRGRGPAA